MPAGGAPYIEGWNGSHPMSTDYSRSFSTIISADDTTVVVPLPDFPPGNTRDLMPGMVVAQVELHREELDPDRWCAMPNVRKLGDRLTLQVMSPMWRPTRNGRVIAIQASEDSLELPLSRAPHRDVGSLRRVRVGLRTVLKRDIHDSAHRHARRRHVAGRESAGNP